MIRRYLKLGWWLLAFIHVGLIWSFSSRSGAEVGLPAPYDKAAHFFSYALLGYLFAKAFNNARIGFIFAALYGITDEIHQGFVPMRDASFWDRIADALGAYFGSGSIKIKEKPVLLEPRAVMPEPVAAIEVRVVEKTLSES